MLNTLAWAQALPLRSKYQRWLVVLLFLASQLISVAQQIVVLDAETQDPLVGVDIYNDDETITGTTDTAGIFYLDRNQLPVTLSFSYLGYTTTTLEIDSNKDYTIHLAQSSKVLNTFTLVGRTAARQEDLPYEIKTLDAAKIKSTNPGSSADALENSGEVYIQRSQHGGGSPIVRGFEANKVLLVVDGVRLNNAIFRSGHLQNIITVDPSSIEKIDLIFGPGSLIYGSDALGGVIHINTIYPKLSLADNAKAVNGQIYSQYASASNEYTGGVRLTFGSKKWANVTSVNYSIFGDLRTGSRRTDAYPDFGKRRFYVDEEDTVRANDDENLQRGTAYNQLNIVQKWKYQINKNRNLLLNLQYSTSSNVPRYDALTEFTNGTFRYSEWDYGPQLRWMNSIVYSDLTKSSWADKKILNIAYQKIGEDRITRTLKNPIREYQEERLDIYSLSYDLEKKLGGSLLQYGIEAQYNELNSSAFSENIFTEETANDILTRYPDGDASTLNGGIYLLANQSLLNDKLLLNAGLRHSFTSYDLSYQDSTIIVWPDTFYEGVSESNQATTYSFGARYLQDQTQVRFLFATAFRAPNIDDIAKIRIKRNEINIPAIGLDPERSRSIEISIKQGILDNKIKLSATGYYTKIEDLIIARPSPLPDGANELISRQDTFLTIANANAQEGTIRGLNISLKADITDRWSSSANINFTKGDAELNGEAIPLAHIAPSYGNINTSYKSDMGTFIGTVRFNGAKAAEDFDASVDNLDLATPEGSLAYHIWSIYYSHTIKTYSVNVGLENILDTHYRNFASGVSGAGINFSVRLAKEF